MSFYIPFHFGIPRFPAGFSWAGGRPSLDLFQANTEEPFEPDPLQAFWTFSNFHHKVVYAGGKTAARVRTKAEELEQHALALQQPLEQAAGQLYPVDKEIVLEMLAKYSNDLYFSALGAMDRVLTQQ